MKLIARRNDLNVRLTCKFGYGPSGILGRHIELSDLGETGRAAAERSNRNCCANRCACTAAPHAPSFYYYAP